MTRITWTFLAAALLAAPSLARADQPPSSTDEARSLAGRSLPREVAYLAAIPSTIPTTTDAARALARVAPLASVAAGKGPIDAVSTTDQARGVAGGLLVVAPRTMRALVAHCGSSCACGRH